MYHCPACGFELNGPPWRGEDPSWNICPCCGIEFGYDEYDSEFFDRREAFADEAQSVETGGPAGGLVAGGPAREARLDVTGLDTLRMCRGL